MTFYLAKLFICTVIDLNSLMIFFSYVASSVRKKRYLKTKMKNFYPYMSNKKHFKKYFKKRY